MFGSRKPQPGTPPTPLPSGSQSAPPLLSNASRLPVGYETVIGAHTRITGDITSTANVRIDGHFDGSIQIEGNMIVGEAAQISADIHAHNITIAGSVHGDVSGAKVMLARTARVWGDISAAALTTEEGAFLDGRITMPAHPAAQAESTALTVTENIPPLPPDDDTIDAEIVDEPPEL